MATETQQEDDTARLDEFQIEIQKVTDFVKDSNTATSKKDEKDPLSPSITSMTTPSDLSVSGSYSYISDDKPYIHGAALSSPKAEFHQSAIPDVVEIHDLLTTRDQTLFFIADSDDSENENPHYAQNSNHSDSDELFLKDTELSQERRKKKADEKLQTINEDNKKKQNHKKQSKKIKKHKSKLQQSLSERGLTFAISEGHVYFNWSAFIREFLYNFFNLFALPIILYCENKSGAESRYYWPANWGLFGLISFFQVVAYFYINGVYAAYHNADVSYSLVILVYNVIYISRISVIAIKWAYLPPQIFVMMRKKKLTQQQLQMIHLLSGWVGRQNKTGLAREIGQCCARLELDINKLKLCFRDERKQQLKSNNLCLRRTASTYVTYGNLLIPYVVFCASRYVVKWANVWKYTAIITSPLICSLPLIARIVQFNNLQHFMQYISMYGAVWYVAFLIFTSINLTTLVSFAAVIALDFKRRYQFVRFSTRLIELKKDAFGGFVNYTNYKQHLFPEYVVTEEGKKELKRSEIQTLDLSDAETMYNWSLLRAFFLDFGLRFLRREEAILGYFTLSIVVIVVSYLTLLYLQIIEANYWESSFVVMSSFAVLTPAFAALRYATRINQKVAEQRSILADKRLRLENEKTNMINNMNKLNVDMCGDEDDNMDISQHIEASATSIGRASVMLEKIMKMLEVDRFRIRLLGYPIDTTVTGIIAAIVGTIGFLVARLLLGSKVQGLPDT